MGWLPHPVSQLKWLEENMVLMKTGVTVMTVIGAPEQLSCAGTMWMSFCQDLPVLAAPCKVIKAFWR